MQKIMLILFSIALFSCSDPGEQRTAEAGTAETDTLVTKMVEQEQPVKPVSAKQRKNVLDYYQALEPPFQTDYPLRKSGEKWLTNSSAEYEIEATVDLKNGYIEIEDEGTGGGTITLQVVLFRMADGNPMLAINETFFDGLGMSSNYHFLHPEDQQQYDWTEHTLPVMTPFDFLSEDAASLDPALLEEAMPVNLKQPQHGTTLSVHLDRSKKPLYCSENSGRDRQSVCDAFDMIEQNQLELKWNRERAKFE